MGNIKENYELMFTAYPDIVNIIQLYLSSEKWAIL